MKSPRHDRTRRRARFAHAIGTTSRRAPAHLAIVCALVAAATTSHAATYWIDAGKAPSANCGTSAATACPSWSRLMGTSGCPSACGCDGDGCENDLATSGAPDVVNFVGPATWVGDGNGHCVGYPFDRTAASELTIQCSDGAGNYTPGNCAISGSGLALNDHQAVVMAGASTTCNDDPATYVKWKGINVKNIPAGTVGWRAKAGSHLLLADSTIDGGTTATADLVIYGVGIPYVSFVNNTITNCSGSSSFGCLGNQQNDNEAVVGNRVGPLQNFPQDVNVDCITVQDANRVLVDGNTCHGMADGIDAGQLNSTPVANVIIRYNDVYDIAGDVSQGADNHIVYSGDEPSATDPGPAIVYKNVMRFTNPAYFVGGLRTKERSKDVDSWYNTTFGANFTTNDVNNTHVANLGLGPNSANMPTFYNIFDGTGVADLTSACGGSPTCPLNMAVSTCTAASCKWVGNGVWYAERGGGAPCIWFNAKDASGTFKCDLSSWSGGAGFNGVGANSGNFRADPAFARRGGANLADYRLTSASTSYVDTGDSFCHATAAGSGNTITVSCQGASPDPRHYFPQPGDYYALANGDCAGKGVRAAEANGGAIGCYDLEIAGCGGAGGLGGLPGVRTITSMTANSITFAGAPCTWAGGAKVHVPWAGSAPDVGALEFASTGSPLPAPTLIDVQPVP